VVESNESINAGSVLFGSRIPTIPGREQFYSLAWTGNQPGENVFEVIEALLTSKSAKELFDKVDSIDAYQSVP